MGSQRLHTPGVREIRVTTFAMKRFAKLRGDAFYNITSPRFFRAIEFPSSAILVAFYGAARFYNIALAKKRDFYLVAR